MNDLKAFNEAMEYIERHLDDVIDYDKLGIISNCPTALFSRIFSILSGISLGEYIRIRKLSKAATELYLSNEKVIDIALKYGYDSVDAFSAAFKRYHKKTPSQVKKGEKFQILMPLKFSLKIEGGRKMDVKIIKKDEFKIAGLSLKGDSNSDFPKLWKDLFEKVPLEELEKMGSGQSYGSCYGLTQNQTFNYMAGYDVKDLNIAKKFGLEILEVPSATYAVIKLKGAIPECIHKGWKYVFEEFFPQTGYSHAQTPDFEVYFEGDMNSDNYEMELWVPVKK